MESDPSYKAVRCPSREGTIGRTPVMGLRAEARRLSYIKHRQLRRYPSSASRRSVYRHGKKFMFQMKPSNTIKETKNTKHGSVTQWTRSVINRLSFIKLFKKQRS